MSDCFDLHFRTPPVTSPDCDLSPSDAGAPTVSKTDMAETTATVTVVAPAVPAVPTVLAVPAAPDACSRRTAQRRGLRAKQIITGSQPRLLHSHSPLPMTP